MDLKVRLMTVKEVEAALVYSGAIPTEYGVRYEDGCLFIDTLETDWFVTGMNSLELVASLLPCTKHSSFDNVVLGYFVAAGIVTVED